MPLETHVLLYLSSTNTQRKSLQPRCSGNASLHLTLSRRRAKFILRYASSFTLAEERSGGTALKLTLTSAASRIPTELNGMRQRMVNLSQSFVECSCLLLFRDNVSFICYDIANKVFRKINVLYN